MSTETDDRERKRREAYTPERFPTWEILRGLALVLFSKRALTDRAVVHDRRLFEALGTNEEPRRREIEENIDRLRASYGSALLIVAASLAVGFVLGRVGGVVFGAASPVLLELIGDVGVGLLLWATLALLGYEIMTPKNATLIEKLDRWAYRILYIVGSAMLALSTSWPKAWG